MAACPHCKEQIENGAKKCHHCGLWVTRSRRFFGWIKSIVEFLTFVAAILVLVVMVWHSYIMKDSLKVSERSLQQIDSSLALSTKQTDLLRQQLYVESKAEEVQRKNVMEEKRPRIAISSHQVTLSDTGMFIRTELLNQGN